MTIGVQINKVSSPDAYRHNDDRNAVNALNVAALRQGTSGMKVQTSSEQGNRLKFQTRVVSNANKVNLKFEEAKPVLEAQLAKLVAGIL